MSQPASEKKTHYALVRKYFNNDASDYRQYYEGHDIEKIRRKLQKRSDWTTYTTVLDGLLSKNQKVESVVDVGCGIGNFLIELMARNRFTTIVGVDFLRETMRIARENQQFFSPVDFVQADLLDLPFEDRCFDVTVCLNVLHHVHPDDLQKALGELARITKNHLMVEIRNKNNVLEFFFENVKLRRKFKNLPQYTTSLDDLHRMIENHGLLVEQIKGRFPATWMCRRLVCVYKRNG